MKTNTYKIMQNDVGYFVAVKVSMNNDPNSSACFWQQCSKTYANKGWADRALNAKLRKEAWL